jgi:hypothetical protein
MDLLTQITRIVRVGGAGWVGVLYSNQRDSLFCTPINFDRFVILDPQLSCIGDFAPSGFDT